MKWGSLLLLSLFIFLYLYRASSPDTELLVFENEQGWGYQIVIDSKVFIHQPTIPAISENCSFPDEESARKAGSLVIQRIKTGKDFSLTTDDINRILHH